MLFLVKHQNDPDHAMHLTETDLVDLADELNGCRDQPENVAQAIEILEDEEYTVEQVY